MRQVYRWQRRFADDGDAFATRRGRCGRRATLAEEDVHNIVDLVTNDPFSSLRSVVERLDLTCSRMTVWRRLREAGIRHRIPARKIDCTNEHRLQRLNFALQNLDRNWDNTIFTDEKIFCSDVPSQKPLYRRDGTRYEDRNVLRTRRSGRITLSLWGWMSAAGPGELVRTGRRMNAAQYIEILETVMLPSVRAVYGDENVLYVQDNSAVHSSRLVREWFERHPQFTLVAWPAKSPDLNPIENLWSDIVRRWGDNLGGNQIRNVNELHLHSSNVWESYRYNAICGNLVQSMHRRLQDTIDNNGLWTKY